MSVIAGRRNHLYANSFLGLEKAVQFGPPHIFGLALPGAAQEGR